MGRTAFRVDKLASGRWPLSSAAFAYACSYQLACELEPVELLVIGEISNCGAAALEVLCRRMQQVARVLWRCKLCRAPRVDLSSFGGIGVLLMADFAQLLPVMSTSLMSGMSVIERGGSGARSMALAGRQVFANF